MVQLFKNFKYEYIPVDDNGPFYTQLGFSPTFAGLKEVFVERLGAKENEVRPDESWSSRSRYL